MITELQELGLETYTIQEVCKVTGLSRTFLIRLEQMGLIKPHQVDEKTGYRKYTIFEISGILQYRLLREMEISQEEILDYFTDRSYLDKLIEKMRVRKNLIQRAIEELELRLGEHGEYSFSFIDLPDVKCYCGRSQFVTPADVEKYTARLTEEVVRLGFTRLSYEPLFSMRWDSDSKVAGNPEEPYEATVCIPISSELVSDKVLPGNQIGHIENIRGGRAFSLLHHGGYKAPDYFNPAFKRFWEEVEARALKVSGPVRGIGIVAPYVGLDITPDDYVFRFAALVEE